MSGDAANSGRDLTPPRTDADRLSWVRLLRSPRVGIATFFRLMTEHGTADAALAALPGVARAAGLSDYVPFPAAGAHAEIEAAATAGAAMVAVGDPAYPPLLAEIPDPPPFLWCLGDSKLLRRRSIAVVGARNASSLGARMARRLATDLGGHGFVVVSGLARGIDTAAHTAALPTGTTAVLAGGVDVVYPSENAALAAQIAEKGCVVSEMPMHLTPQARHFPRRNRIVSGLSEGVVVVEAAARSGTLLTARAALDQNREVLAVPGHPFDARAHGCNMLIRDGATLVRGADDILAALDRLAPVPPDRARAPATSMPPATEAAPAGDLRSRILDRLGASAVPEDQVIRDLAARASEVSPAIVALELEGRIRRAPGGLLSRAG